MIEVNGVIYRNLEEQVQKNKEDIENLQNQQSGDDSDIEQINNRLTEVETTLTEITPDVMRALKTPISAPNETKLVAVDNTNSQEMIGIGTGLIIENNTLKSTGGTEIIDNLTSSSISAGLSANQGRVLDGKISQLETLVGTKANQTSLDLTNQNVSQNTINISTINGQISNLDSQISTNTEDIEFLQSDIAGKTNVTINNVHQDYVNFSSDPQTQINLLRTTVESKPNLLDIYPIGSIYLTVATSTTGAVSPASFFGGSWERLPEGYALWTASSGAGGTLNAGLPNIQGNIYFANLFNENVEADGAFTVSAGTTSTHTANNSNNRTRAVTTLDASKSSSIFGNSNTVQPPAYKVYAWKRIA